MALNAAAARTFRTRRALRFLEGRSLTWKSDHEHYPSGPAKSVRTAVGRQIFAAAGTASSTSARKPSSTACRARQIQNENPSGWSGGLEAYTGAVSADRPRVGLRRNGLFTLAHWSPELRTRPEAKTPGRGLQAVRSVPRSRGRVL